MSTEVTVISANKQDTIDLSQPAGLQAFLLSVREVYQVARQFEATARADKYVRLALSGVAGEEVFATLHQLWGDMQRDSRRAQAVVENGGELPERAVAQMQRCYDDLMILRDFIESVYSVAGGRHVQKMEAEAGQEVDAAGLVYREIEEAISRAAVYLEAVKARVLNQLSVEKVPVGAVIDQLTELQGKVKTLQDRIRNSRSSVRDVDVLQQAKVQYIAILKQVSEQATTIEQNTQQRFQSVTTGTTTAAARPGVAALLEEAVEIESATPSSSVKETADVLMRTVVQHPFYAPMERSTADALYLTVQESITSGASPSVQAEHLAALTQYVQALRDTPEVSVLSKRIAEIMRRITASLPFDSDTLRTARMLERKCKEAFAESSKSKAEKIATYHLLEEYVISHEAEWLVVCGVAIPEVGESGVSLARKMREVLLIERDRNQAFIQDQRKQIMVDKLIRKLSFIPPAGFDEDDLLEIKNLIRAIDVPNQQVKHHEQLLPEGETEQPEFGVQAPQHYSLPVSGDDESVDLAIRVALRAAKRSKTRRKKHSVVYTAAEADAQIIDTEMTSEPSALVAKLEKRDPVSAVVPSLTPKIFPATPEHDKRSLTKLYLSSPFYQEFIVSHYTSPAAFERMLDTIVTQIESKTTDVFERWLGEEKASAFLFMEEQTVGEILQLAADREVRSILAEQNIKYETFLAWIDMIEEMQTVVGEDTALRFGELYARWVIESEMIFARESVANNSQV
ncbi:hypothetical protein KC902_03565 [Candidatus Kaiserbacteria bacterium]|nr:hypothetical protein [Candidatus Kaiserbacteria bacterium]